MLVEATVYQTSQWVGDEEKDKFDPLSSLSQGEGTLPDINHSNIFLNPSPRIMEIKAKVNKWDLHKLESFCTAKESVKKNAKTTHRFGENIFKCCEC